MKRTFTIFCCLLAGVSTGTAAGVPKKVPFTQYARLWTDSPFTSKPLVNAGDFMKSPLDDYSLCGVTQVAGGYSVTLLDKKKPDERMRIEPGSSPDYRVVDVIRKDGFPLATTVRISYRGMEKVLEFDEKLLALKAAPQPQHQIHPSGMPGRPPLPVPQMGNGNPTAPAPRPVVVPPQRR